MPGSMDIEATQHLITECVTYSNNPIATINSFEKTLDGLKKVVGEQFNVLQVLKQGRICAMCDCIITEEDEYIIDGTDYVCIACAGRAGMVVG